MQRSFLEVDSIKAAVQLELALEAAAKATGTRRGPAAVPEEVRVETLSRKRNRWVRCGCGRYSLVYLLLFVRENMLSRVAIL